MLIKWFDSLTLLFKLLTGAGTWRDEQPKRKTLMNKAT
ncbi:hypothetical protein P20480_0374 [Pseudoalteromonas sp. BSi20480]|nr:hypothetical protein P20480_0374 [Pseudoalteromonas sp. BSi20480]